MYAVILFAGMTASADVPQELLPHRPHLLFGRPAGCQGAQAVALAVRPRPLAALFDRRHRAAGCAGTVAVAAIASGCAGTAPRSSYGCAGATFAAPMGCSGGGGTVALVGAGPQAVAAGGFLQRVAVHRQLRIALGRTYDARISDEQRAAAQKALSDPDLYEAAVTKVHRDLVRSMQAKGAPTVAAFGDGHILQLLLDNLPKILDAIRQIIALFG